MAARHLTLPQPSSDGTMLEEPSQDPLLVRLTLIPKYKLTRVTLGCYPSGSGRKCSDHTTGTQDGQGHSSVRFTSYPSYPENLLKAENRVPLF